MAGTRISSLLTQTKSLRGNVSKATYGSQQRTIARKETVAHFVLAGLQRQENQI